MGSSRPKWLRAGYFVAGTLCLALAGVFTFIPGPNWLFFIPGATLLATESGSIALMMDALEKALSPLLRRIVVIWKRLGRVGRALTFVAFLLLAMASAYLLSDWLSGR